MTEIKWRKERNEKKKLSDTKSVRLNKLLLDWF